MYLLQYRNAEIAFKTSPWIRVRLRKDAFLTSAQTTPRNDLVNSALVFRVLPNCVTARGKRPPPLLLPPPRRVVGRRGTLSRGRGRGGAQAPTGVVTAVHLLLRRHTLLGSQVSAPKSSAWQVRRRAGVPIDMVGGEAHDPGVAATSGASEGTTVATTPEPAEPSSRSLVLLAAIHRFLGRGEGTDPTPGMLPPSPGGGEEGASTGAPTMQTSLRSSEFRADANVEETGARDPGCSGRCDDHRQRRPDRVVALSDYATHHCRYDDHGSAPGGRRGARGGGEGFRRKADGWEGDGSDGGLASANWERESGAKTEGGPSPRTPLPVAPPPVAVARVREASPARGPRMPGEWAESSVHLPAVQQSRRGDRGRRPARVRDPKRITAAAERDELAGTRGSLPGGYARRGSAGSAAGRHRTNTYGVGRGELATVTSDGHARQRRQRRASAPPTAVTHPGAGATFSAGDGGHRNPGRCNGGTVSRHTNALSLSGCVDGLDAQLEAADQVALGTAGHSATAARLAATLRSDHERLDRSQGAIGRRLQQLSVAVGNEPAFEVGRVPLLLQHAATVNETDDASTGAIEAAGAEAASERRLRDLTRLRDALRASNARLRTGLASIGQPLGEDRPAT